MSDAEQERPVRISLSEEKLRAALAEFKVDLLEELAKYASREQLIELRDYVDERLQDFAGRLRQIELWRAGRDATNRERRDANKRQLGWLTVAAALGGVVATFLSLHFK